MPDWIRTGRLPYFLDVLEGFEQMPTALRRLLEGGNIGKQVSMSQIGRPGRPWPIPSTSSAPR
jgi:hypothetical protein